MMSSRLNRREFLKTALATGGALALPGGLIGCVRARAPRRFGPNDTIRVAVAGLNGRGGSHIRSLVGMPGVQLVALCDPDDKVAAARAEDLLTRNNVRVETCRDIRRLLDRDDIDAVTIAAPNHWHSLMGIWAAQAGKSVYVEKPVSHNIYEGRKLVEAAAKYGTVMQVGSQSRSDTGFPNVFEYIREGHIGKLLYVHGCGLKTRKGIGNAGRPVAIPDSVDFDLWCGPAPLVPPVRERLHYDWHWFWDTGNGEIGNQGIHEVDAARWALGQPLAAERIMSFGGRYAWDDDGQTPNVQVSIFDYKPAPLIFEVNNLPVDPPGNRAFANRSVVVGIIIQCEGGYYAGKHGGSIFDNDGKEITKIEGGGSDNHMKNFIDAMRAGRPQDVTAPVIEGHLSSTLHHAANASYRMGRDGDPERVRAAIKGDTDGNASLDRVLELLARHENVDLRRQPLQLGPWLTFDPKRERYTGALAEEANATLGRDYRAPYVVPERV